MSSIGSRLRDEREVLGFSQTRFAEIARTTRKSQFNYETDARKPDAEYLAAIAEAGADVHYILTGERERPAAPVLTPDEQVLVDGYRALDSGTRKRVLAFILTGENERESTIKAKNIRVAGHTYIEKLEK